MQRENKTLPLSIWIYIPLWVFFVYLYLQIINFTVDNIQNLILGGMYFVEFGVHEVSHIVAAFLPPIFTAAAGSLGEIFFTVLIIMAAIKGKAYFAAIFGALWFTQAMNSVGRYMADARAQQIPLAGFSDRPKHDWNFVFGQLGWLNADIAIGTTVRVLGDFIGAAALVIGLWLIISKYLSSE